MVDFADSIARAQPKFGASRNPDARLNADTRRNASAGLNTLGGTIQLNYGDPILRGVNQMRVYLEMGDDPTCGVLLYLMLNIVAGLSWDVREHSPDGQDVQNAQFLKSCMNDMGQTWGDFIGSVMSFVQFGHSPFEQVYKVRDGRIPSEPNIEPSAYSDGKIGWADFQLIGQDTITRWDFDENNRVMGVWQRAAPTQREVRIDAVRLINFRTSAFRDNPMGMSIFRRAYPAWRQKRALENIEGIAIERDLCGLPVVYAPPEVLADNATEGNARLRESLKRIACDMRTDEQMGVLFPNSFDSAGNQQFRLELMNSGGARSIDVSRVIDRYNGEIFRTALADFLGLGQGTNASGSWAMHNDKTQLFLMGLRAYLKTICETLNRIAIPRLFAVNGIEASGYPEIYHTPLDQVDIQSLAAAISSLAGAGMPIFPNAEIERRICEIMGLPAPVKDDESQAAPEELEVNTQYAGDESQVVYPGDSIDENGQVTSAAGSAAPRVDHDKQAQAERPKSSNRIG